MDYEKHLRMVTTYNSRACALGMFWEDLAEEGNGSDRVLHQAREGNTFIENPVHTEVQFTLTLKRSRPAFYRARSRIVFANFLCGVDFGVMWFLRVVTLIELNLVSIATRMRRVLLLPSRYASEEPRQSTSFWACSLGAWTTGQDTTKICGRRGRA